MQNDLRHGKGIVYDKKSNIIYEDDFVKDIYEGYYKLIYENGSYYRGSFKNGIPHGEGRMFEKNDNNY